MPLSYRQVKDLYDILHQSGATQASLPEWAQKMQSDTGSDLYAAGLNDNLIKQASVGIDKALEFTGLPDAGGYLGRMAATPFGMGDQGEEIGHGLPRMAVNLAPLAIGGPLGLGLTGALSGAETYTATGSPAVGLLSGITNAALPAIAGRAEQGTLAFLRSQGVKSGIAEALLPRLEQGQVARRWIGSTPTDIDAVKTLFPRTFGQTAASNITGQVAAVGLMGASDVGQSVLAGDGLKNPFTPEMALNLTLGQLPFSLLHLGGKALGFGKSSSDYADVLHNAIAKTEGAITRNKILDNQIRPPGISSIPDVEVPTFSEDQQNRHDQLMASLGSQKQELQANPTPENLTKLADVTRKEDQAITSAMSQGAKDIGMATGYTPIKGETTFHSPDRGFRVVHVTDPQGATYADGSPVLPGDKVGFSTGKHEPKVNGDKTNDTVLLPPKEFYSKLKDKQFETKTNSNQPELPVQDVQLDLHQHLQRTRVLADLEKQLAGSRGLSDRVEILSHLNEIRDQLGFSRLDLPQVLEQGAKSGAKDDIAALQSLIEQTKRRQAIDLKGTQNVESRIHAENEFQNELRSNASPGSDESAVIDYYDSLAHSASGRRAQAILEDNGVSPFWKRAMELAANGELTRPRMKAFVEGVASQGKGLSGNKQQSLGESSPFKVISSNDAASVQLASEAVRRATAEDAKTPVGKVIRELFKNKVRDVFTGASKGLDTKLPSEEEVADAAEQVGIEDKEAFAKDFHNPQTDIGAKVEEVMKRINDSMVHPPESLSLPSNAPTRIEDVAPWAEDYTKLKNTLVESLQKVWPGLSDNQAYESLVAPFNKELRKQYDVLDPNVKSNVDKWYKEHQEDDLETQEKFVQHMDNMALEAEAGNLKGASDSLVETLRWVNNYPKSQRQTWRDKVFEATRQIVQGKGLDLKEFEKQTGSTLRSVYGNDAPEMTGELFGKLGELVLGEPSNIGKPEGQGFVPTPEQKPIHDILSGNGESLVNSLLASQYPEYRALAKDLLANFPLGLRATQGKVASGLGLAATQVAKDRMFSQITFHPSVLDMAPGTRDSVVVHELGHALSLNLLEKGLSPELEGKLEDIRRRAIEGLPKKLRSQYDKVNAEDYITRSQESGDKDMWDELAPSSEGFSETDRQILYGLLNHKELISQSWSSDSFKNYLKKLPGKVNGLQAFINWTKQLFGFGDKHDNLLRETLETSHALMSHGEFLTSAEDYGRAYFEGQGKSPVYGEAQTKRALGLLEEARFGISPGEIAGSLATSQGRANEELNRARGRVDDVLRDPEDINHQGIKDSLAEFGHAETTKGIDDMVVSALDEGHDLSEALEAMPLPMAKYIFEKLKDQKDIVDMLQSATAEGNKGVMNITKPEVLRKPLFEIGKRINQMLEAEAKEKDSAQALLKLSGIDPFGFLKSQLGEISAAPGKVEEKPQDGKIPVDRAWLARFLEPMGQMALRFPETSEIISKGFQLVANGRKLAHNSLKILGANIKSEHLDVIDKASVKEAEKIASNPVLRDGVNKWIAENQFKNRDAVSMLNESDPVIAQLKQKYTTEQWDQIRDFVTKQGMSRQKFNADKLEFLKQISATTGGGIISDSGLKVGENIAIADAMRKAIEGMSDPLRAEAAKTQFEAIRKKLANPEDFIALLEYSKGEAEKLDAVKETLDKNPFWAPAQRMEQYLVTGTKNGKAWKQAYSSVKEAEAEIKAHGVKAFKIEDQFKGKEDEPFELPGMSPAMLERMRQIEENQIKILVKAGVLDADGLEAYRKSSVVGQVAREADAGTGTSGLQAPPRLLSHGAEDLPWLRNHIVGIQREARYLARTLLRSQAKTYLKSPELRGDEQLRSDLGTHFESLLEPDPEWAKKMTRFASTWFMGFNVASTLVNATQPFLTHVSEMTAMTGRPLESYKRVTRAVKEAIAGSYGRHAWATEEHERFMKDMAEAGERSLSMYDDEAQDHEAVATGMLRALDKQKPQTLGQKLSSAAGVYSTVAMMPFKAVEQINASAALLASFDYYREKGFSYEEARDKASTFNRGVNFSGGRGQRPVLAFAGRGAYPRGSAMLGTALQSYVLGTTSQIGRYLQSGFFRPKGITPYETYSARKAAVQMLGTQLAAAGLLGLPFVSGAIALLDKLFPELELNKKIREGVGSFLSSDQENGSPLSDIAMTGVPSMLGWDLQSRLSMGNTLPGVSEVNGFQPENLIGPMANIVKNFVGGVQGWAQGDPGSTGKFLPPAVRKLIETGKSTLTDGGAIRDYQGRPLSEPTRGEQIGQAIGFQPKRLSDQNAASRILKQTQDVESQKSREENQRLAQEVMKGNYGTVRQTLLQRMQTDKNYNPEDAVRAIANNVEDLTLPRDLRREGDIRTSGQRSGFLSSFSNLSSLGSVTEVARLQLRQEVERKLGLARNQSGELKVAQLMDQLKQAKPDATRVELRQTAQQMLRRSSPRTLQMSQE